MASATVNSAPTTDPSPSSHEDIAVKAVTKRFEGLVAVRNKAVKGKGAWYWAHLDPVLIRNPDTNLPKAVKLKCSLCDAVFSASNPSRTATEHLKRGTCPNFSSLLGTAPLVSPLPISSLASPTSHNHRKRSSFMSNSLALVETSRLGAELSYSQLQNQNQVSVATSSGFNQQHHLILSGGKEDLGALAMLEDSVKKLKSPKSSSPGPVLSKDQIDSALDLLAEWFYESCGSVSFSTIEHPKFRAFLNHVGLPAMPQRELLGSRLDTKFGEAKNASEARIRDALFIQVSTDGWKSENGCGLACGEENLIKFSVNLPNGARVFQKAVFTGGAVSSSYAEEVMWEAVTSLCGGSVQRCVGIVADKFQAKALRNLENRNQWMVNISCQVQGFICLIKDFSKDLPLFRKVTENCLKLGNFINSTSPVRNSFQKYRMQEFAYAGLLRVPSHQCDTLRNFGPVYAMLEDILSNARVLQMVISNDSYNVACLEDPIAREVACMIGNEEFWNELEAVYSLFKLIKGMAQEIEADRPLIGQCIPLWKELRVKVKDWCAKFSIAEEPVEKIVEKRFRKNYHPAWSAAFILDPLYLMRDTAGKYLPPFKFLTQEQEKDVDKVITRLVSREEAHIALMELMKWRSEGLDPLYAQAVQLKQEDPVTGKMKIANPQSSRLVWETCLSHFKSLGKVAVRLIFLQATSSGFKCNWSFLRWFCIHGHSRVDLDRAKKMIFIAAHAKLERRDFSSEEAKDAELFATSGSDDDMLNENRICLNWLGRWQTRLKVPCGSTSEELMNKSLQCRSITDGFNSFKSPWVSAIELKSPTTRSGCPSQCFGCCEQRKVRAKDPSLSIG